MLLELDHLQAGYRGHTVLRDISLTVDIGEVVAVLGANGAGKSTLLRTIAGLQQPSAGEIRFDGTTLGRTPTHRRARSGLVLAPEGQQSFPEMTVAENLLLAAQASGKHRSTRSAATEAIERMFDLFPRLKERARQAAGTLSGGERQMLSLSRALLSEPRLLLLDEPSHGLAPIIVEQLCETIQNIAKTTPILLVEQNLAIPTSCATRVVILENSRIKAEGDLDLLKSDHIASAYLGL